MLHPPTLEEIAAILARLGLGGGHDLDGYRIAMNAALPSFARVESLVGEGRLRAPASRRGERPEPGTNPTNAWYLRTSVREHQNGSLAGMRIALKDSIALAGIGMRNGSSLLEGYTPEYDATVVQRLLGAGAEIAGKAVCEDLCISGASETSAQGSVHNPYRPGFSAGGSSSGCGSLVALGEVEAAIGCDQGGSIRIPAAWCGVVGLKPTYGLVPYTGIMPIERTLDHTGPMARDVSTVARVLNVIAGDDPLDPRQGRVARERDYTADLEVAPRSLRIGVLDEGFGWPGLSEPATDSTVRTAASQLAAAGMAVETLSIPLHRQGIDIMSVISVEGATSTMIEGFGQGNNWKGFYPVSLNEAVGRGLAARGNKLYPSVIALALLGHYTRTRFFGRYYGLAQEASRHLHSAYDSALARFDALLLPTVPFQPWALPTKRPEVPQAVSRAYLTLHNTAPFDATGHPAISLNAGFTDGLPVGLMLVGSCGRDHRLLQVARAVENVLSATIQPPVLQPCYV